MPDTASLIVPAPPKERFTEIDALRGFALFGILLANLPNFLGIAMADSPEVRSAIMGDLSFPALSFFVNFVLDGKFYTIFSLLFGLGFALQLERLDESGANGTAIFLRRMAILLLFGLIHLSFIWSGDILTFYALVGFTLVFFRKLPDAVVLALGLLLIFAVPFLGVWLLPPGEEGWTTPVFTMADGIWEAAGGSMENSYFVELKDNWWGGLMARAASEWAYVLGDKLYTFRIPKVMGTILIGMWAGRMLLRGKLIGNRKLLWSVLVVGAAIAIPVNWIYAQQPPHSQTHWSSLLGTAPAGLAYAAAFLLALPHLPRAKAWLAEVGRMALTNYLLTSVICVLIFYGAGLGLMGSVTLAQGYAFGCVLFVLIMLWSHWWLAGHKQGPMEALWRRLTYPAPGRSAEPSAA